MFLPYDTLVSFWSMSSPLYRWEPVEPAPEPEPSPDAAVIALPDGVPPDGAEPGAPPSAPCRPVGPPRMRLVFQGFKWSVDPVYSFRENVGWSEAAQRRQEGDEAHRDEVQREQRRQPAKPPEPKAKKA